MIFSTLWTERNDLKEKRLAICKGCDFFNEKKVKCMKCGCFLNYKALLPSSKCPIGKWTVDLKVAQEILGVQYQVTEEELKVIYRKLCLEKHPDVNKSPNAKEEFQNLQTAYVLIKNNLGLLPPSPKPLPKGFKIFEIFRSLTPTVIMPDVDEDVILFFIYEEIDHTIVIPKDTILPCQIKYGSILIQLKKEEAPGVSPELPIGTVWGRDYSIK
jgi:hypothetical protein